MSKQKVLFPKSYCKHCHRVRTNWNNDQYCDWFIAADKLYKHGWEF